MDAELISKKLGNVPMQEGKREIIYGKCLTYGNR